MSLTCQISGEVPEVPVISPLSNCIFEKRLIEDYIKTKGVDPITGEDLSMEQLLSVKTSPVMKAKPPSATSVPAILKIMQDEWDSMMLQNFTLKQQVMTLRQELSHSLYQNDAACRVIVRLNKELTALREAIATLKPQVGPATPLPNAVNSQPTKNATIDLEAAAANKSHISTEIQMELSLTSNIIQALQDKASTLTAERKKRGKNMPSDLTKPDSISLFKEVSSNPALHNVSVPGILSLDINPMNNDLILTGGNDKQVVLFDKSSQQIKAFMKGHTKKVSRVIHHCTEDIALTASPDQTVRVWNIPQQECSLVIKAHSASVTGLSLHATGDYVLSGSSDEYWALSDIRRGGLICRAVDDSASSPITCIQFHPDGMIFGSGTSDAMIKIWDLKEKSNVANFPGHSGSISDIAFSENGYYLATASNDNIVKLWDLRKLKNFKTLTLDDDQKIESLSFDYSGTYLVVAGNDIRVFLSKQWTELVCLQNHRDTVTCAKFAKNAQFLASTSFDRNLKIFSAPSD